MEWSIALACTLEKIAISRYLRTSIQSAIVALTSYAAGVKFTTFFHSSSARIGAVWCVVAGIVVLQASRHETMKASILRLVGTFVGAFVGAIYLLLFPYNIWGMSIAVGVTVLLSQILHVPDNGRLAAITVVIVLAFSAALPDLNPWANAGLRFFESCIGASIAVLIVLVWPNQEKPGNQSNVQK
jgi:uncharacterized membrane protein YccC